MKLLRSIFDRLFAAFRKSDAIEYVKTRNITDYIRWVQSEAARLDNNDETKDKYLRKLRKEAFPIKLFLENTPSLPIVEISLSYQNESWDAKGKLKSNGAHQNAIYIEVTGTRGYNGDNQHLRIYRAPSPQITDSDDLSQYAQLIKDRIYKKTQNTNYDKSYILLVYCEVMHSSKNQFGSLIEILHKDSEINALLEKSVFEGIYVIQWDGQHAYQAKIK
ncbi:MAG: hypothetical protein AB7V32_05595 [Candidatus Berkiella sp.]